MNLGELLRQVFYRTFVNSCFWSNNNANLYWVSVVFITTFEHSQQIIKCFTDVFHSSKKCPYSDLFWPVFSHISTEYGKILSISQCLVRMRENTDQNNSEYGHFHSVQNTRNI